MCSTFFVVFFWLFWPFAVATCCVWQPSSPPQGSTLSKSTMPAFAGLPPQSHPKHLIRKDNLPSLSYMNSKAVGPCWVSRQLDRKQSRVGCYQLCGHKFCIFRQVTQALGTWLHLMPPARSRNSLTAFIISTDRLQNICSSGPQKIIGFKKKQTINNP